MFVVSFTRQYLLGVFPFPLFSARVRPVSFVYVYSPLLRAFCSNLLSRVNTWRCYLVRILRWRCRPQRNRGLYLLCIPMVPSTSFSFSFPAVVPKSPSARALRLLSRSRRQLLQQQRHSPFLVTINKLDHHQAGRVRSAVRGKHLSTNFTTWA